jgi:UDP-glucose 4-epimerase
MSNTVLVTGGAGFIGHHVVKLLLESGYRVTVLDDFSTGLPTNLPERHPALTIIKGDIAQATQVQAAVAGATHIVHLAALASVPRSIEEPALTFQTNVQGVENLLAAARQAKLPGWFIFASSAAVYGPQEKSSPTTEADAHGAQLQSPYAASKRINEMQAQVAHTVYGLNTIGLRFFNVYGAGQRADSPYAGVLAKVVESVQTGSLLTIYGDGLQTRDFIAVSDVALVIRQLLARPVGLAAQTPRVMNLGGATATTLLDAIRQVVAITKVNPRVEYRAARGGDLRYSCADIRLLQSVLANWQPAPLSNGLRNWLIQ